MISSLRCCVSGMNWFYVFLYDVTICNDITGNGQGCSVRDEIFAARVRKLSFNPLAGKSELRLDTFCVCLTCLKFVLIPLRGKVNCGLILALIAHTTVLLSFNPLAGKSELRLITEPTISIPLRGKVNCGLTDKVVPKSRPRVTFQSPCGEKWIAAFCDKWKSPIF